jgi:hypothetical protein
MAFTNNSIASNVPYTVLSELRTTNKDPTFATIQVVQVELNDTYASVYLNRGDGLNVHLILTVNYVDCPLCRVSHVTFDLSTSPPYLHVQADDTTLA